MSRCEKVARLAYTPEDWKILERLADEHKAKTVRRYIDTRLHTLVKNLKAIDFVNLPAPEDLTRKQNIFFIPQDISPLLLKLAQHHHMSVSHMVRMFTTDPLLKEHYDSRFLLKSR